MPELTTDQRVIAALLENPMGVYQVRVPRTDDELWNYVYRIWGIAIPRVRVCPHHVSPFEAFAEAFFARNRLAIWKASRSCGKTLLLALLSLTEQVLLRAKISLLGGSGLQSQRVHDYISGKDPNVYGKFWQASDAPRWLQANEPTKMESLTIEGGLLKALMASPKSIRGQHPQRLRMDEIDEMDQAHLDMALPSVVGTDDVDAQIVCSSTHHHPDGTMTEMLRRAEEEGYPIRSWCYKEVLQPHGWLKASEIEAIRKTMPAELFRIEFDLGEPKGENRMLTEDVCLRMFDKRLGIYTGEPNRLVVVEQPLAGVDYFHGVDWAQSVDWTVQSTFARAEHEGDPDRLARWLRTGRLGWDIMCGHYDEALREYGGPGWHDDTGVGKVCRDFLEEPSEGFDFSKRKESDRIIGEYLAAVEHGQYLCPHIIWAFNEHKYATWDMLFGSGHKPDSMVSMILAHQARMYTEGVHMGRPT